MAGKPETLEAMSAQKQMVLNPEARDLLCDLNNAGASDVFGELMGTEFLEVKKTSTAEQSR